jgi:hypothetical protein
VQCEFESHRGHQKDHFRLNLEFYLPPRTRHRRLLSIAVVALGCVAVPSGQLEVARRQLADLGGRIRAVITRISPQTVIGPSTPKPDRGCTDPYDHDIGDTTTIEKIYARTFSWSADDGSIIEMIDNPGSVLGYEYSTGCRLPAAWRTDRPPAELRPVDDTDAHYPYLYRSPGGRTGQS